MSYPDFLSLCALDAVSEVEAERMAYDSELLAECSAAGVALSGLLDNMRVPAADRLLALADGNPDFDLLRLLHELNRREVRFVLIGGLAGRVYCSCHGTNDFDICHARDERNLRALAGMLSDIGAEFRRLPKYTKPAISEDTFFTETDFVFTSPLGRVDLIGEFTGVGRYEEASSDAVTLKIAGLPIQVLSLPKLIAAKESTGRPKDQQVYRELRIVRRALEKMMIAPAWADLIA